MYTYYYILINGGVWGLPPPVVYSGVSILLVVVYKYNFLVGRSIVYRGREHDTITSFTTPTLMMQGQTPEENVHRSLFFCFSVGPGVRFWYIFVYYCKVPGQSPTEYLLNESITLELPPKRPPRVIRYMIYY